MAQKEQETGTKAPRALRVLLKIVASVLAAMALALIIETGLIFFVGASNPATVGGLGVLFAIPIFTWIWTR